MIDQISLDHQLKFLDDEIRYLKSRQESWVARKIKALESVHETVRLARQAALMTTMGGKRIDER